MMSRLDHIFVRNLEEKQKKYAIIPIVNQTPNQVNSGSFFWCVVLIRKKDSSKGNGTLEKRLASFESGFNSNRYPQSIPRCMLLGKNTVVLFLLYGLQHASLISVVGTAAWGGTLSSVV
jgi:hypothetical protein